MENYKVISSFKYNNTVYNVGDYIKLQSFVTATCKTQSIIRFLGYSGDGVIKSIKDTYLVISTNDGDVNIDYNSIECISKNQSY